MIRKNDETGNLKTSFKKFSDMNKDTKPDDPKFNPELDILPDGENRPGFPNLPIKGTRKEKATSTRYIKPLADKQDYDKDEFDEDSVKPDEEVVEESNKVKLIGKVAKMPKGVKASKGFNFLENVKISKNSIWYLMIEKQDNGLQLVKYNVKKGVNISDFVNELKSYYIKYYAKKPEVIKLIESIEIDGNDRYTWLKNIPTIEVDGKKMISKIAEDLIKLLSK